MGDELTTEVYEEVSDAEPMYTFFPFIKIEHDGSVLVDGQPSDQDIISQMNIESAKVLVLPYSKMVDQLESEGLDAAEVQEYQELIEEIGEGEVECEVYSEAYGEAYASPEGEADGVVDEIATTSEESDISETMLHDHNYEEVIGRRGDAVSRLLGPADTSCYGYMLGPLDQSKNSCDLCQKTFNTPASLKRHVRIHTGERPFQCQICEKYFSQQSNLWKHVRTHTGERPFECPHCGKRFSQRANMKKHLVIHTGERPFVCYLCSRAFTQQANLSKHMRLHTGEKPYCCSYCDKRFTQRSNLQKHEHLHEGIKPYTCEVCFQAFTQQSNLKKHEMMHKNVRKYVCDICLKSYVQKVSLVKHRQRCALEERGARYVAAAARFDFTATDLSAADRLGRGPEELIKHYEALEERCLDLDDDIEEVYDVEEVAVAAAAAASPIDVLHIVQDVQHVQRVLDDSQTHIELQIDTNA